MDQNEIKRILKHNGINEAKKGKKYIWRTRKDNKVRSSHASRDGKIFEWDKPPPGGHPGEDYGCRCTAETLVEEPKKRNILEELNEIDYGRAPGLSDQINPFGIRGNTGSREYQKWFEARFPNTVAGAKKLISHRIDQQIQKHIKSGIPIKGGSIKVKDVDIQPDMKRFGDESQNFIERNVVIGSFEFDVENIQVEYTLTGQKTVQYDWSARVFIREQTGVGPGEPLDELEFLAAKRILDYGGWEVNGAGSAKAP